VADTSRAREMLTAALNKSPKPAIIVDDIIVTELNLGSVPPELEILEIGDLAEDRFRGIFKLSYSGDAFLTLKTRVQANPLNTYLADKRKFAAPDCLAASSGLTIPVQITLSDITLSGFVILVFSKTKGVTVVFRNDPLESLKVSSTFDSIPFIKDYLQKEIEAQLRVLFVEDLPAILHRLSLRLWSPEYREADDAAAANGEKSGEKEAAPIDPLASPPQDPIDPFADPFDETQPFSLDTPSETLVSQKNLLRLAALTDSQHTLSLFTPSIRDAVFRAWAGAAERGDHPNPGNPNLTAHSLSKVQSTLGTASDTSSIYSLGDSASENASTNSSRPSLFSHNSTYSLASHGRSKRKGKKRVVDLRKKNTEKVDVDSETAGTSSTSAPSLAVSVSDEVIPEEREDELQTPPISPKNVTKSRRQSGLKELPHRPLTYTSDPTPEAAEPTNDFGPPIAQKPTSPEVAARSPLTEPPAYSPSHSSRPSPLEKPKTPYPLHSTSSYTSPTRTRPSAIPLLRSYSAANLSHSTYPTSSTPYRTSSYLNSNQESTGGILEQAWMMKMAAEIARKVAEEKAKSGSQNSSRKASIDVKGGFWGEGIGEEPGDAPPAYAQ